MQKLKTNHYKSKLIYTKKLTKNNKVTQNSQRNYNSSLNSESLDKKNEDLFKSHLKKIASKQTLIITTQRFSMLDNVDRIIVLDKGKIVADANKSEILSKFSNHG